MSTKKTDNDSAEQIATSRRINEGALAAANPPTQDQLERRDPQLTCPQEPPEGYAADGSVIDPDRHAEAMRAREAILNPTSPATGKTIAEQEAAAQEDAAIRTAQEEERARDREAQKQSLQEGAQSDAEAQAATTAPVATRQRLL